MKTSHCAVLCLLALPPMLFADGSRIPTFDESLSLERIDTPLISPDGRFVAYRLVQTSWKDDAYVRQLWLANVATGARFQLTRGKKSVRAAEWSPDGRWLAFVGEREANAIEPPEPRSDEKKDDKAAAGSEKPAAAQIWLISPEGGEAWQLTRSDTDVDSFHWSKDGRQMAFTAPPPDSRADKDRKERFGEYQVFEKDYKQTQLWTVDVAGASAAFFPVKATQVTKDTALNVTGFAWSPDSARIAFSAARNPLLAFAGDEDLYLLDLAKDATVRKIVGLSGPDDTPVFSPDGTQLAFHTALAQPYDYYANGHIAAVDVDAVLTKAAATPSDVRDLTASFDEDVRPAAWGPEGIYFLALQKTASHLFRLNPRTLEVKRVTAPGEYYLDDVSFTADFGMAAIVAEGPTQMAELFVSSLPSFAPRQLTEMTAQVKDWKLGSVEVAAWKSQDGATIEGVLHKPADFDPKVRHPLLVVIHGGPTGVSQPTLSPDDSYYPVQAFLEKGALVLEPNYRGSAGYGAAFRALNARNLGVGDMWDVMSGVDSLVARGLADPARLGAMGWSEGGYISAFLTTHTDRFKAISAGAGISDWTTYYVSTDITPFTRQYLHATPWDDPAIYAKTSPITTIKQAKTPTLIQLGSADKRVPVPNSFELYRGLQDQKVPSRLILYTGFGHPINKPKSNRALLQANLDWFGHYIWGEPFPKDSPILGSSELGATP